MYSGVIREHWRRRVARWGGAYPPFVRELFEFRHGAVVLRDTDGSLYVGQRARGRLRFGLRNVRRVDPAQSTLWLFPLLESDPADVPPEVLAQLPTDRILIDALESGGSWASLAVDWLSATGHISQVVRSALAAFAHGRLGTQSSRHAARSLLKATEPPGGRIRDDQLRAERGSKDPSA